MLEAVSVWEQVIEENLIYIARLPAALFSLAVAYVVLQLIKRAARTGMTLARVDLTIQSMLLSVIGFMGWVLALAVALSVMQLNQLSLALGGTVALVAMALASGLNNVTQDLMAGIFLLSDKAFHVGVRVRAAGVEGIVEGISIRKTLIRTPDGWLHTIPNRNIDAATYSILDPDPAETEREQSQSGAENGQQSREPRAS